MNPKSILLIEPDHILAKNLTSAFMRQGYKTVWHVEPQAATYAIDESQPCLVILDISLAGRSGIEFLYEFRSYPEWDKIPAIIYSSVSPEDLRRSAPGLAHLNIASFLYKPDSSFGELLEAASRALAAVPARSIKNFRPKASYWPALILATPTVFILS